MDISRERTFPCTKQKVMHAWFVSKTKHFFLNLVIMRSLWSSATMFKNDILAAAIKSITKLHIIIASQLYFTKLTYDLQKSGQGSAPTGVLIYHHVPLIIWELLLQLEDEITEICYLKSEGVVSEVASQRELRPNKFI